MDIVKQMRSFESDHEPDGWPAIKMKQVSELCDEIERLRSEIDAANAQEQEPKFYKEKGVLEIISAQEYKELISIGSIIPEEFEPLYARPIPAQQTPAVAVHDDNPNEWIIEKLSYHKFERNDLNIDGCLNYLESEWKEIQGRTTRQLVMQILELLAAAPSTRVTEQDDKTISSNTSEWSQRVTEQDALEIAIAYSLHRGTEYNTGYAEMFARQFFAADAGRAILDKLNGDKNGK